MTPVVPKEDLPISVSRTKLWSRLSTNLEYVNGIREIRSIAAVLAHRTSYELPEYTDHSVSHMDALWEIADQVLTPLEIERVSPGETLLLGASFYVHDLGMALPVTSTGKTKIRSSKAYQVARARFSKLSISDASKIDEFAIREATRELHAKTALDLATKKIPGLDTYLIENTDFRACWGNLIGTISESHHWSLSEVERILGARGVTPSPDGELIDLAFVACALRVIDFAHINRKRAPVLERLLRSALPKDSLLHWHAQEHITGPSRDGDSLVFGCTQPIANIEAWWLFHDLATGLDTEIKGVYEYLKSRAVSAGRFSLQSVKGIETPTAFNRFVRLPEQVVPVDIRIQPDSMERVVELLGGPQIYGNDQLAPIRELIQNARDAIELRLALDKSNDHPSAFGRITVGAHREGEHWVLKTADNGVGMSRTVVQHHLVSVGSDFWNSVEFYRRFSSAVDEGFQPIGRFGIGFLSVFMLGDHIEVETEAYGGPRIRLTLEGLGRRGELVEMAPLGQTGTEVRIRLKASFEGVVKNLAHIVRARAPMLSIPIVVNSSDGANTSTVAIEPGWWKEANENDLFAFLRDWSQMAREGNSDPHSNSRYHRRLDNPYYGYGTNFGGHLSMRSWPSEKPHILTNSQRLISSAGEVPVGVLVCSQGIAIEHNRVGDISGLVDLGTVELNVAREKITNRNSKVADSRDSQTALYLNLTGEMRPAIIEKLNTLDQFGMLPGRVNFIRGLVAEYGHELLDKTTLPWIPVTEPPGNIIHKSKKQLIEALKKQQGVLIAVGAGSGSAYGVAAPHIPSAKLTKMLMVAIIREETKVDYEIKNKLENDGIPNPLMDELDIVLDQAHVDDSGLILTSFLIRCIAEAWTTSPEELRSQDWRLDYKDSILWAELERRHPLRRKTN